MKNRILLILGIIIFSSSITSAKLINHPFTEGDEEVKVLVLEKNKNYRAVDIDGNEAENYPIIIKIGDRFNIKEEDGKKINGYLGKITDEGSIVIINKEGLIVGTTEISKITQTVHKGDRYMIDAGRYSMKIQTRIITAKSKRKKEIGRSILGKTIWTALGIAGTTLAFRRFL